MVFSDTWNANLPFVFFGGRFEIRLFVGSAAAAAAARAGIV